MEVCRTCSTMSKIAVEGEAMGFDYLTLTDHVVLPDTRVPGYPYSETGEFYEDAPLERLVQLLAKRLEWNQRGRIVFLAQLSVHGLRGKPFGFRPPDGGIDQADPARSFDYFFQRVPRKRLRAAVK